MWGDSIEPLAASWPVACRELHVESSALCWSQLARHMQRPALPLSVSPDGHFQGFLDTFEEVVRLFECHASVPSTSLSVFIWKIVIN